MFAPKSTGPIRVAIACQGGGSHTAFTAGVLKPLLRAEEAGKFKIIGLSGTRAAQSAPPSPGTVLSSRPGVSGIAIR